MTSKISLVRTHADFPSLLFSPSYTFKIRFCMPYLSIHHICRQFLKISIEHLYNGRFLSFIHPSYDGTFRSPCIISALYGKKRTGNSPTIYHPLIFARTLACSLSSHERRALSGWIGLTDEKADRYYWRVHKISCQLSWKCFLCTMTADDK